MAEAVLSPAAEAIRKQREADLRIRVRQLEILEKAFQDDGETIMTEPPTPESLRRVGLLGVAIGSQLHQENLGRPTTGFKETVFDRGVPFGTRVNLLIGIDAGFQMGDFGEKLGLQFLVQEETS